MIPCFSVAEGVAKFKEGHHAEAMQHLNKALQIDEENVEAMVARGAMYVNIPVANKIHSIYFSNQLWC